MKYKLRAAVGVPAEVAGTELERIHSEHGALTPHIVLDEARPDDAPLHPVFEWDDAAAAESHRLWQARNLIRCVHVVGDDGADKGCAYVNVTMGESREYVPVAMVAASPDLMRDAVEQIQGRIAELQRSMDSLLAYAESKSKRRITKARKAIDSAQREMAAV